MKKSILDYKAVIFDVDGTLYYQLPVRCAMLFNLLAHYIFHPLKIKELFAVSFFRKLLEKDFIVKSDNFYDLQYQITSEKFNLPRGKVKDIIYYWLEQKPLKYIRLFRDKKLINLVEKIKAAGLKTAVYSDYPASEKIKVLNFKADFIFSSNDAEIMRLKPDAKGLNFALQKLGLREIDVLYVGDRYEKDGLCAINAGVDFLILSQNPFKRNALYKRLGF